MGRSTSQVKKRIGSYACVRVEGSGRGVVSQVGTVLLVETVRKTGLDTATSAALAPWRRPRAVQDPAGCGARSRPRWRLPGRHRHAAG